MGVDVLRPAAGDADRRVGAEGDERRRPPGLGRVVVVDEHHPGCRGRGEARVAGGRQAAVRCVAPRSCGRRRRPPAPRGCRRSSRRRPPPARGPPRAGRGSPAPRHRPCRPGCRYTARPRSGGPRARGPVLRPFPRARHQVARRFPPATPRGNCSGAVGGGDSPRRCRPPPALPERRAGAHYAHRGPRRRIGAGQAHMRAGRSSAQLADAPPPTRHGDGPAASALHGVLVTYRAAGGDRHDARLPWPPRTPARLAGGRRQRRRRVCPRRGRGGRRRGRFARPAGAVHRRRRQTSVRPAASRSACARCSTAPPPTTTG